jgi:transcriptional regulator with XRE-family HTH domain
MNDIGFKTPAELQVLFGEQLQRLRLAQNLDQRTAAEKAGISEKSLRNLEAGRGSTVETMIRTLKALNSLDALQTIAPTPTVNPLYLLRNTKTRRRASRPRATRKVEP